MDEIDTFSAFATEIALIYGLKFATAMLTLFIGLWIIGVISRRLKVVFEHAGIEITLRRFLHSLINIGLKVLLLISVAAMAGIETTSFIAVLGAAGLAVGLALQGALANFAGGVLILVFRPYEVGDYISAAGESGTVRRIEVFSTILTTGDNKTIILPNGAVSNAAITNYSTQPTRRVDLVFGIGYEDDLKKAKSILAKLIEADERILKEPTYSIAISSLGDSSVNITTKAWVNSGDYWGVRNDMLESVKLAMDENGISIPYPQTDVHLYQKNT